MEFLIDDNEVCPCGSNNIYSRCCKSRKDEKVDIDELIRNESRLNAEIIGILKSSKISTCFHPNKEECTKKIIDAHSIQENGVLSLLAKDGEVIYIEPGVNKNGLILDFKAKTKRKVTTFKGFCSYHDKELFKPIEDNKYEPNSNEHNFLLAYRAFAYEFYKKIVAMKSFQKLIKKKPSLLLSEEFVSVYRNYQLSLQDLEATKVHFNEGLLNRKFDIIESVIIPFDYRFGIATSFTYSPYFDLKGNPMNFNHIVSKNSERLKANFVTLLPQFDKSYIIYSWLAEDRDFYNTLITSLRDIKKSDAKRIFKNLTLEYTENLIISPYLWNRFPEWVKDDISKRVIGEMDDFMNPIAGIESMVRKMDLNEMTPYNLFREI